MKNLLTFVVILFVTGCASLTTPSMHNVPWPQQQKQLKSLKQWSAEGSIGARSVNKGLNASFSWQQQYDNYTIQLFGPFGINRTQLIGNKQQVTLQTAKEITLASASAIPVHRIYGPGT